MDAGRELDALVAEKVMGWLRINAPYEVYGAGGEPSGLEPVGGGYARFAIVPNYSTDIKASWRVVEAMRARGYYAEVSDHISDLDVRCAMFAPRAGWGYDPYEHSWDREYQAAEATTPLAICRAALAALAALEEPAE